MNKPKAKIVKRLDYSECAEYIEQKLGYKLRDTLGKFTTKPYNSNIEYRDFWHAICDRCDIHNPCEFYMPMPESVAHEWIQEILNAFWEEFGEGPYWVSW